METQLSTLQKEDLKKIRERYKDSLKEIKDHFSRKDSTDTEKVHELRVNLKRIDALLALLRFNGVKLPSKKIKAFRDLFKMAGKLRTKQVEFEIISKYFTDDSLNPTYLHQLHEEKAIRLEKYSKLLQKGPSKSLKNSIKTVKTAIDRITRKNILGYFATEEKRLSRRLSRSVFREQELHLIRKDLKRFYLNMKIADRQHENVERLLDLVGQWHDHQIAFDHVIKAIYTANLTERESDSIRKIKFGLIGDKEHLYEDIVSFYVKNMNDNEHTATGKTKDAAANQLAPATLN